MNFIVDAQLPPALSAFLNERGHNAWHVAEIGCRNAADRVIWDEAFERHGVLLTKDEGFAARASLGAQGPAVVWVRVGNCSNDSLLRRIDRLLPEILAQLEAGERIIEVL